MDKVKKEGPGEACRCTAVAFGLNAPLPLVAGVRRYFCFMFQVIRWKDFPTGGEPAAWHAAPHLPPGFAFGFQ
jgi:hypothetical protein